MTKEEAVSRAQVVGLGKIRHPYGMSAQYDVPEQATHVLVRPERRKGDIKVSVVFLRIDFLSEDFKPKNKPGKYFFRLPGAGKCLIAVYDRPSGWHYDVRWSK